MNSIKVFFLFLFLLSPSINYCDEEFALPPIKPIEQDLKELPKKTPLPDFGEGENSDIGGAPDFQENLVHMLSTLALLLGVVLVCAYILKRVLNARIVQMNESSVIKILERRSLNPKSIIYLVEVEGRRILIGESASGLHALGDLNATGSNTANFNELMNEKV